MLKFRLLRLNNSVKF